MLTFNLLEVFILIIICVCVVFFVDRIFLNAKRRKISELNKQLAIAAKAGSIGVWSVDLKTNIVHSILGDVLEKEYQQAEELTPYFYSQDDLERFSSAMDKIVKQEVKTIGVQIRYKNYKTGNYEYIDKEMMGVKGRSGKIESIIGTHRNVTQEILLNRELQTAREKAEQSDRLKSLFLANMSHEIRTPLNSIVGFSQLIAEDEIDVESKAKYTEMIKSSSELLLKIINDVLDLSKIEAGYLEITNEVFDFVPFVKKMEVFALGYNVKSEVEIIVKNPLKSCLIYTDKQRLKQLCVNYLTNAIKYTAKGKVIFSYNTKGNGLYIQVEDTGIGIAEEHKDKVFSHFEKFDKFAAGVGLGLSICRAIVESMGGEVGFSSEKDKGSIFWLFIPDVIKK